MGVKSTTVETYEDGQLVQTRTVTWATTPEQDNADTIQQALQTAVTYFGGNYTNWSALTNAQKDTAAKNGQRALAQIARWLLGQFDEAG